MGTHLGRQDERKLALRNIDLGIVVTAAQIPARIVLAKTATTSSRNRLRRVQAFADSLEHLREMERRRLDDAQRVRGKRKLVHESEIGNLLEAERARRSLEAREVVAPDAVKARLG
jgi:hypothetical protein